MPCVILHPSYVNYILYAATVITFWNPVRPCKTSSGRRDYKPLFDATRQGADEAIPRIECDLYTFSYIRIVVQCY